MKSCRKNGYIVGNYHARLNALLLAASQFSQNLLLEIPEGL